MAQLIPQASREQERMQLLKKICDDFKKVCDSMDDIHKDRAQHVEDICWMKLEVSQTQGKAALESHEAVSLHDPEAPGYDQPAYQGHQGGEELHRHSGAD